MLIFVVLVVIWVNTLCLAKARSGQHPGTCSQQRVASQLRMPVPLSDPMGPTKHQQQQNADHHIPLAMHHRTVYIWGVLQNGLSVPKSHHTQVQHGGYPGIPCERMTTHRFEHQQQEKHDHRMQVQHGECSATKRMQTHFRLRTPRCTPAVQQLGHVALRLRRAAAGGAAGEGPRC